MTGKLPLGPIAGCVYFTLMGPLLAAQPANMEATNSTSGGKRHGCDQTRGRVSERPESFQ